MEIKSNDQIHLIGLLSNERRILSKLLDLEAWIIRSSFFLNCEGHKDMAGNPPDGFAARTALTIACASTSAA